MRTGVLFYLAVLLTGFRSPIGAQDRVPTFKSGDPFSVVGASFFAVQVEDDASAADWYRTILGLTEVNHQLDSSHTHEPRLPSLGGATRPDRRPPHIARRQVTPSFAGDHGETTTEARVEQKPDYYVPIAQAHVWLGQHALALDALDEARRLGSQALPLVAGHPCFMPLFHLDRYKQIFAQAGIPLTPPPNLT